MIKSLVFLLLWNVSAAWASVISIQVQGNAKPKGNAWVASVTVTNVGDEPAHRVQVTAALNVGEPMTQQLATALEPGKSQTVSIELKSPIQKPGQYPLFIWIDYADANQHPFSAVSLSTVFHQNSSIPSIYAVLDNVDLAKRGTAKLQIKNNSDQVKDVEVQLFFSKDIDAEPRLKRVALKPFSNVVVSFKLSRFAALPGSTYPLFAVMQYETKDAHYFLSTVSVARIVEGGVGWVRPSFIVAILFICVLIWAVFMFLKGGK